MMSIKIFQCPWDTWDRGYDRKRRERCKSRCRLLRRDPLQNRWSENINDVNMQPIYYNSLVFLRAGWQFSLKGVTTPDTIKHNRLKLWEARASIEQPTDPTVSPASCSLSSIKTLKWKSGKYRVISSVFLLNNLMIHKKSRKFSLHASYNINH